MKFNEAENMKERLDALDVFTSTRVALSDSKGGFEVIAEEPGYKIVFTTRLALSTFQRRAANCNYTIPNI